MKVNSRLTTTLGMVGMLAWCSLAVPAKTAADTTFIKRAAEGGMAEVELGKLAVQKAASPDVKQFAQRMVDDHTKAGDQLQSIASDQGVTLPTTLNATDQALKDRLDKLSGAAFDWAYMEAMVKHHTADVNEFRHEANSGSDPSVKSFASTTLPTLEEDLQMAQNTLQKVKAGGLGAAARQK